MPMPNEKRLEEAWEKWRNVPCPVCRDEETELDVSFAAAHGTTWLQVCCDNCGWFIEYDIGFDPSEEQRVRY